MMKIPDRRTALPMLRHGNVSPIKSNLDAFEDILSFLRFCTTDDYVRDLLTSTHGVVPADLSARASRIAPHVQACVDLAHDALKATPELSFLPAYYSLLNALKVIILLGPDWADLPKNRHHGASYEGVKIDYPKLDDEEIKLLDKGVIPLAHKTITMTDLPPGKLRIGDIYPFLSTLGSEYSFAYGQDAPIVGVAAFLRHHRLPDKSEDYSIELRCSSNSDLRDATALPHDVQPPAPDSDSGHWTWGVRCPDSQRLANQFRAACRLELLHDTISVSEDWFSGQYAYTLMPLDRGHLALPEEIGLALFFFHLSNVVRYKPDQLYKARSTRIWPFIRAGSRHGLFRGLVLLWSQLHKSFLHFTHT